MRLFGLNTEIVEEKRAVSKGDRNGNKHRILKVIDGDDRNTEAWALQRRL